MDDNHIVNVKWQRYASTAAQITLSKNGKKDVKSELWRLGTRKKPLNTIYEKDLIHSIAIIAESAQESSARSLAAILLDTGTADQVLISKKWKQYLKQSQRKGSYLDYLTYTQQSQWLYIGKNLTEHVIPKWGTYVAYIPLESSELSAAFAEQRNTSLQFGELSNPNRLIKLAALQGKILDGQKEPKIKGKRKPIELSRGMKLMPIPKGVFFMGSNNGAGDEIPVHKVTLNYDFYMSQTEVTFTQYDAYAAAKQIKKPSDAGWGRDNRPVINVSWTDAQGYVNWLTEQNSYALSCRLPSEAEWEYAARAGTKTKYFWGDKIGKNNANCESCGSQWDNDKTAPVASFKANIFGLHDMHGNVWEWVQDCYHDTYKNAPKEGAVWEGKGCVLRVLRGGSWSNTPSNVRSAFRFDDDNYGSPDNQDFNVGFRVVCSPPSTDN